MLYFVLRAGGPLNNLNFLSAKKKTWIKHEERPWKVFNSSVCNHLFKCSLCLLGYEMILMTIYFTAFSMGP
jgi:hypothetical protein